MSKKKKSKQKIEEEKIQKIIKRLEGEDKEQERINVEARLIPSPPHQDGADVKIKLQILDRSFYAQKAKVFFNAGTENFEEIEMEKLDMDNFAVVLANIPKEITIVYYITILDKSGAWQQYPRPELIDENDPTIQDEPYFSFSVEPDGSISFKKEWDDSGLVNCAVCGYACQPSWDVCPECKTPLYDTTQAVFEDEQKAKIEARKALKEQDLSWEDATDEEWRTLPECPNCGYTVQLEWAKCPVCKFDLTSVELEKKDYSYEEFMSEEDKEEYEKQKQLEKLKKSKKKTAEEKVQEELKELGWDDDEGSVDIL